MPDAGFSSSAGAKGGLVPLFLIVATIVGAAVAFVMLVVVPA